MSEVHEKGAGILTPNDNDVLFGRGGNINIHPGNENFRKICHTKKRVYLTARFKKEKQIIVREIIKQIKEGQRPQGRFLDRDVSTGLWHEVGDDKERDKTSQALRENAPSIRREIEDERDARRINSQMGLPETRQPAERHHAMHHGHGQPEFYNEYHGESAMPLEYKQESLSKLDPYPYNPQGSSQYNDDGMVHKEVPERIYNRPHSHPYENDRYLAMPSDQQYSTQRTNEFREASHNSRPSSAPTLNFDCGVGALNEMTEMVVDMASNICDSTANYMAHHNINGAQRQNFVPILSEEDNKPRRNQNEAGKNERRTAASPAMFDSCNTTESMFNSLKHLVGRGEDSVESIEMEELSSERFDSGRFDSAGRFDSYGSIGGQSLVHVFDGDSSMKNKEASEQSPMSY